MALVSVVTDGAQGPGLSGAGIAGGAAIVFVGFVVIVIIFLSGFASYQCLYTVNNGEEYIMRNDLHNALIRTQPFGGL